MNRNVVITGGTGGIGSELVGRFLSEGDYVFFSYHRSAQKAEQMLQKAPKGRCGCAVLDLADPGSIGSFAEEADRFFIGRDRILINNAGISLGGPLQDMDEEAIERLIAVDLTGTILLTRRMLRTMIGSKESAIINITSVWGEHAASCESVYASAKAGLEAFTRSMARELSDAGIRVNAIAPGFIDTPMNAAYTARERGEFAEGLCVKRIGLPSDVAGAASFLASADSSYINGQILRVDGGYGL
ncbi:MAG: SDR family oxidoreductase [Eubacteriaceae bacterium]|nr:SDR family oxidoreductase [Eubacteriaceae bacterium]